MPKQSLPARESTTDLVAGMMADARDLALANLEQMQRELRGDLGRLREVVQARALALAGLIVAAVLGGQALALGLARALGLPVWAGLGALALLVCLASILALRSKRPTTRQIDLVPDDALAAASREASALVAKTTASLNELNPH